MSRWPKLAMRAVGLAASTFAVVWAVDAIGTRAPDGLYATADAMRRGETFQHDIVLGVADGVDPGDCRIETREGALLIRISMVSTGRSAPTRENETDISRLLEEARLTLSCSPASGLAWFGLFLAEARTRGLSAYAIDLLTESFRFSPHEAWLQLLRLQTLLPVMEALGPPLKSLAMRDYTDLLDGGLDLFAATLVVRAPPALRTQLLDEVCRLSLPRRRSLVVNLSRLEPRSVIEHRCLPDLSRPSFLREQ